MKNEMMQKVLCKIQIDLGKNEDQVIELCEGSEFLIDKVLITNASIYPVQATGCQISDNKLLFTSVDSVGQYDYLNSLLNEDNYCLLKAPTDGFPVVNSNNIVKTNKLNLSISNPHRGCKADLYVLGYVLK